MIARLKGVLIEKTPPFVVLDCNGVGYECEVPMGTFYNLPAVGDVVTVPPVAATDCVKRVCSAWTANVN